MDSSVYPDHYIFNNLVKGEYCNNVSCKKVFLKISQNSQENTCARVSFLIKLQAKVAGLRPATLLKKGLWHKCFPVNFAKFLRALIENLWWLILYFCSATLVKSNQEYLVHRTSFLFN